MVDIGFQPTTMGIMAATYAGVVPFIEIRSGILADRWSRRGVLIIAQLAWQLNVVFASSSMNVSTYLLAAVMLGGGVFCDAIGHR